ncbi:glycosyltransferase family 2 protein [Sphingobium sp. CFD-2]|uniref:glycosyltransferase family 2 protein n=1 Tax=Sphingobium sp. CFD-2 TaxID=2878542 RepID=UPI00214CF327|nr:glycosyltransferase [Sphingobium sp. CFD-2]
MALLPRLLRAWLTLEPKHWLQAADSWLAWMAFFPKRGSAWLIAGRLLKAAERYDEARLVLARARALSPDDARIPLIAGRVLRALGERAEAIEVLAEAFRMGLRVEASAELCRYGARDRVPGLVGTIYANRDYADFIAANPVPLPPASAGSRIYFHVLVDETDASLEDVERTLASLLCQSCQPASIWTRKDGGAPRRMAMPEVEVDEVAWQIILAAGVSLHPQALAWLSFAIHHVGCGTVYTDSDHGIVMSDGSERRTDPVLHPMTDDLWFGQRSFWPVLVASRCLVQPFKERGGLVPNSWAELPKPIAHVPRILATSFVSSSSERDEARAAAVTGGQGRLSVIIPTRDNPDLLAACIESLHAMALEPSRLDIRVVDNGSVRPDTKQLLSNLKLSGRVTEIISFDEPFNWSRANNIAARRCSGDGLLFLNDDTEMLARGWDDHILSLMTERSIGIIGARMLYPDRTIQHAGFIFGMDNGPQHEGRWMEEDDPGPDQRWCRARQTVAVTGAFMAMRRSIFERLGAFDEIDLAIDFSDIDLCLRARAAGLKILYSPELLLLHHESVSRGFNRSRKKRRRVRGEAAILRARWGTALDRDPGYNPQRTRRGAPFDGLREPMMDEILDHIAWSGASDPWTEVANMFEEGKLGKC